MPISCYGAPGGIGGGLSVEELAASVFALVCGRIWKCLSARLGDTSARETNLCHRASGLVCVAGTPCPSVSRED